MCQENVLSRSLEWTTYEGIHIITFRLTAVLMLQLHTPPSRDFEHSSFANNLRINLAEKAHF